MLEKCTNKADFGDRNEIALAAAETKVRECSSG